MPAWSPLSAQRVRHVHHWLDIKDEQGKISDEVAQPSAVIAAMNRKDFDVWLRPRLVAFRWRDHAEGEDQELHAFVPDIGDENAITSAICEAANKAREMME